MWCTCVNFHEYFEILQNAFTIKSKYVLDSLIAIITKKFSKRQIGGCGVLGFSKETIFFLIILIFNLDLFCKIFCHILKDMLHSMNVFDWSDKRICLKHLILLVD